MFTLFKNLSRLAREDRALQKPDWWDKHEAGCEFYEFTRKELVQVAKYYGIASANSGMRKKELILLINEELMSDGPAKKSLIDVEAGER